MSEHEQQQPSITVVIPCHNHERWVNDALDSVLAQTYTKKRIIVVDDGSTDNSTAKVVSRLYRPRGPSEQNEPWTCYGKVQPNLDTELVICRFNKAHGPSFARNWGMRVAWEGTDAFCFLDSDDTYAADKIAKSVAKWQEMPQFIGAVYSDYDTLAPSGLRLRQFKEPFSRPRLMAECLPNCDSLVSKQAIQACGGFDEKMRTCEDYDLWMRISERFLIVHIPESLVTVRVGEHSASSTVSKEVWEQNWRRVMTKAQSRAKRRGQR